MKAVLWLAAIALLTLFVLADSPVAITTTSLAGGVVGEAYSQNLTAIGGVPPYKWSIATGALPAGLSLGQAGQISGSPSAAGTANFTVKVTDKNSVSVTLALSINVAAALVITTASLPNGQVGSAYAQSLAASGESEANSVKVQRQHRGRQILVRRRVPRAPITSGTVTGRSAWPTSLPSI